MSFCKRAPVEKIEKTQQYIVMRIPIKPNLRFAVLSKYNFTCVYCGRKPPQVQLEVDHVKAVAKGGTNVLDNLVCACFECNIGKHALTPEERVEKTLNNHEIFRTTSEQLREVTKAYGITIEMLVLMTGKGKRTVQRWLSGESNVPHYLVRMLERQTGEQIRIN